MVLAVLPSVTYKAIYDTSKYAIAKYKGEHGDEWYKKSSPKNDLFTDGHDKILELTFTQIKPDANRMPDGLRKNGLTVMNILFFSLIDDTDFMEIYLEKENRKDKSIYGQGMDRPIGYILKIVDELDSNTNDPINTFILSYILFKQYDLLMMMDISLKNQHKEDGAKVLRRELKASSFKRQFELGELLDGENISANFKDGVLSISVPKIEPTKPEKHTVKIS